MKRILAVLIFFILFIIPVHASQNESYYAEQFLAESNKETVEMLESIGITDGSLQQLLEVDFFSVLKMVADICKARIRQPLLCVCISVGVLLLMLFLKSFLGEDVSFSPFIESTAVVLLLLTVVSPICVVIDDIQQVNDTVNNLIKVMIPILAAIITAAGNPTLAICLQTSCLGVGQVLSASLVNLLPAFCAIYSSLAVCSVLNVNTSINNYSQLLKKAFAFILSLTAGLFSALISIKNLIAVSADSVTVKGAKFFIGNAVPIIGGALADSLNTVIASIALLRSTVGIFAIVLLAVNVLPVFVELILWSCAMKILSAAAESISQSRSAQLFISFDGLIVVMSAVTAYQTFICIIAVTSVTLVAAM